MCVMKTVLKLILLYIAFQYLGMLAALPFVMGMQFAATGTLDPDLVNRQAIAPGLALTLLFTVWYLWKAGYLTGDSRLYSPVSARCLGLTVLLAAGAILLLDGLASVFSFLPNWLEDTFNIMQSSWAGILLMAIAAPVVEELFFRGAIERALLRRYKPWVAIVASGLIFGVIHVNPVQVVYASLAGILLGWLYWRTRSLVPCMVVHVLNNCFSVCLTRSFPEAESLLEVVGGQVYPALLIGAVVAFVVSLWALNRWLSAGVSMEREAESEA